jgi:uncharacterized protein YraI
MRAVITLFAALLLFAVVACGGDSTDEPPPTERPTRRPTNTQEPAPALAAATTAPTEQVVAMLPTEAPPTPIPPPTVVPPTDAPTEITASATVDLKIRSGPGTAYPQVGTLAQGTIVRLLGVSQDKTWFQHERGWSSAEFLTTEIDTSGLTVVLVKAPPPTAVPPTIAPIVIQPTAIPQPIAPPPTAVIQQAPPPSNCHPSYPTVCIPPSPPDLDCGQISFRRFAVAGSDPHGFDGDSDGVGCESG